MQINIWEHGKNTKTWSKTQRSCEIKPDNDWWTRRHLLPPRREGQGHSTWTPSASQGPWNATQAPHPPTISLSPGHLPFSDDSLVPFHLLPLGCCFKKHAHSCVFGMRQHNSFHYQTIPCGLGTSLLAIISILFRPHFICSLLHMSQLTISLWKAIIGVQLIHNAVLVSSVLQSDSVLHTLFFTFFSVGACAAPQDLAVATRSVPTSPHLPGPLHLWIMWTRYLFENNVTNITNNKLFTGKQ